MDASGASLLRGTALGRLDEGLEAERSLVERARRDPAAFGELYERYLDAIHTFAFHRLGDTALAEDVAAETFQRALEHIGGFEWRGVPFSAWLYRIASNVIAARYRRQIPTIHQDPPPGPPHDDTADPDAVLIRGERVAELMAAVRALPEDQQQVVVLRFGAELRSKEIAYIMERSEGAVKALLHRALARLHRHLESGTRAPCRLAGRCPARSVVAGRDSARPPGRHCPSLLLGAHDVPPAAPAVRRETPLLLGAVYALLCLQVYHQCGTPQLGHIPRITRAPWPSCRVWHNATVLARWPAHLIPGAATLRRQVDMRTEAPLVRDLTPRLLSFRPG